MSTTFPAELIKASAGTGKTYQLTNRFINLLFHKVPPERILAITFTRKAAREMMERIFSRLLEATKSEESANQLTHALELGEYVSPATWTSLLCSVVEHQHRLNICTLDSFFVQLAKLCSVELGMPQGWSIIEHLQDQDSNLAPFPLYFKAQKMTQMIIYLDSLLYLRCSTKETVDAQYFNSC